MKNLLPLMLVFSIISCAPKTPTQNTVVAKDTTIAATPINEEATTRPAVGEEMATTKVKDLSTETSDCIKQKIKEFSAEKVQNPPRSIYSYTYNGKTVYYVSAVCCDQYSDLYDSNCKLLGHPDGGFTGRGDGKFKEFGKNATDRKLIWQDKRK